MSAAKQCFLDRAVAYMEEDSVYQPHTSTHKYMCMNTYMQTHHAHIAHTQMYKKVGGNIMFNTYKYKN